MYSPIFDAALGKTNTRCKRTHKSTKHSAFFSLLRFHHSNICTDHHYWDSNPKTNMLHRIASPEYIHRLSTPELVPSTTVWSVELIELVAQSPLCLRIFPLHVCLSLLLVHIVLKNTKHPESQYEVLQYPEQKSTSLISYHLIIIYPLHSEINLIPMTKRLNNKTTDHQPLSKKLSLHMRSCSKCVTSSMFFEVL